MRLPRNTAEARRRTAGNGLPGCTASDMTDTYQTIQGTSQTQLTEKRSRFLAFAFHVKSEEEAKDTVAAWRKKYYDARHVCYAYVCGCRQEVSRANDDGEPSGTAGRPILGQILSRGLTFTLVLVVRYFGGVKLGTGPLGVAYRTAAAEALEQAEVETCIMTTDFRITAPYADADVAMRMVREAGADIVRRDYSATDTTLDVRVRLDSEQPLRERLSKILSLRFSDISE